MAQIQRLADRIVMNLSPRDRALLSRVTDDSPARFSVAVDEAIQAAGQRAVMAEAETQEERARAELAKGR
jgi:hypothetical protein